MTDESDVQQALDNVSTRRPLCFVLMPFGKKSDPGGVLVDFDVIYTDLIEPAVRAANLDPLRADKELVGGIIHKPMFECLVLCEYAVADLSFANANVFYELGVRHAVKPFSTTLIFAQGTRLPFDVALDRGLPYTLDQNGVPTDLATDRAALTARLVAALDRNTDSPVFQLVDGFPDHLDRERTDVFRKEVDYSSLWKQRLQRARATGIDAVREAERSLGDLLLVEFGILVDLLLSYRAVGEFGDMIRLAQDLPRPLATTALVREQLAFALNREERRTEAEEVLTTLIAERGPSSETYGLLGRVYKDQWEEAQKDGDEDVAEAALEQAIDAYVKGFESDWRDAYPGINAITLMEMQDDPDERQAALVPVVSYAVDRRLNSDQADYWDFATRLELAVLGRDQAAAKRFLGRALKRVRETWEPKSTAKNLALIRARRTARGEDAAWVEELETKLLRRAGVVV